MLVYFPNRTFLYDIMFSLILLNLYFAVIPFLIFYFLFYEPTLFSKRFAFYCGIRRWINTKVLVVYLYLITDKYFLPFWEDNALIFFWEFSLIFFVFSLTSSNNFSSFTLLIISIGECFVVVCFFIIIHQKISDRML